MKAFVIALGSLVLACQGIARAEFRAEPHVQRGGKASVKQAQAKSSGTPETFVKLVAPTPDELFLLKAGGANGRARAIGFARALPMLGGDGMPASLQWQEL